MLTELITIITPIVGAVIAFIAAGVAVVKKVKDVKNQVSDILVNKEKSEEYYRDHIDILVQQNSELRLQINELLTEISKIKHGK